MPSWGRRRVRSVIRMPAPITRRPMTNCIRMASSRSPTWPMTFTANPDTTKVTFKMTKNGEPFDPAQADNISIYFVPYKDGKFQFDPAADRLSLKGKLTSDGNGLVTSTLVEKADRRQGFVDYTDVSQVPGLVVVYGRDETVATTSRHARRPEQVPVCGVAGDRRGRRLRFCGQQRRLREVPHGALPQARLHLRPGQQRPHDRLLHLQGLPPRQRHRRALRMAASGGRSGAGGQVPGRRSAS